MASEETYKFLGNVEAGTSGTIDFFVTPPKEGKHKAKILVTYEDVSGNEMTVEKEVELTAAQGNPDEFSEGSMDGVMPGSEAVSYTHLGLRYDNSYQKGVFFMPEKVRIQGRHNQNG